MGVPLVNMLSGRGLLLGLTVRAAQSSDRGYQCGKGNENTHGEISIYA